MIHWRLLFRVKDRTKANRKVEEIRRTFGRDVDIAANERYWKDQALWEISFRIPYLGGSPAEIAFDCLILASRLGVGWFICGPVTHGELNVFEGFFDIHQSGKSTMAGLEWAWFSLIPHDQET